MEWFVVKAADPKALLWGPFTTAEKAQEWADTVPDSRVIESPSRSMSKRLLAVTEQRKETP